MKPAKPVRRIVFICTGNQCRSAAAAAILAQRAARAGLDIESDSAGTGAWPDIPAQPDTALAAAELGYSLEGHRSKHYLAAALESADLILTMAQNHQNRLVDSYRQLANRIHLFKPYCLGQPPTGTKADNIPDPIGQPFDDHRACVAEIDRLIGLLVEKLQRSSPTP
jgi:protein-tyrosine-phosphatase